MKNLNTIKVQCDTSILFKSEIEKKKESMRMKEDKLTINPDAFVLCGMDRKNTPSAEVISAIRKNVCEITGIDWEFIMLNTRKRDKLEARQLIHYFLKSYTTLSLSAIGALAGNKDHATVLHSIRVINNLYETDKLKRSLIIQIDSAIKNEIDQTKGLFLKAVRKDTIADWERVKGKYIK